MIQTKPTRANLHQCIKAAYLVEQRTDRKNWREGEKEQKAEFYSLAAAWAAPMRGSERRPGGRGRRENSSRRTVESIRANMGQTSHH